MLQICAEVVSLATFFPPPNLPRVRDDVVIKKKTPERANSPPSRRSPPAPQLEMPPGSARLPEEKKNIRERLGIMIWLPLKGIHPWDETPLFFKAPSTSSSRLKVKKQRPKPNRRTSANCYRVGAGKTARCEARLFLSSFRPSLPNSPRNDGTAKILCDLPLPLLIPICG